MHNKFNMQEIGALMKQMVKKAIHIIQGECHDIVVEFKPNYKPDKEEDYATNGDKIAQEMYVHEIRKLFPTFGILAEEKELRIPSTYPGHDIYFTVDPLDGTKAYNRKQSHGVGTMIALVCDGKVVVAYVGDANTGDIYGFVETDPNVPTVVERERFGRTLALVPDKEPLTKRYALLRDTPGKQDPLVQQMVRYHKDGGLFKDYEAEGGSIGMSYARLWSGEVGALILRPTVDTPWDVTPVIGISQKLGFRFFKLAEDDFTFREYDPQIITAVGERPYTDLIVHNNQVEEMQGWLKSLETYEARR